MLVHILAIVVAFGSFSLYIAAFFVPEVYRKYDFVWSGIGLFYALVLWVCAGRITGGVLLGQTASVALLVWFGWQNLQYRRSLTPKDQRTRVPGESLGAVLQTSLQTLKGNLQTRFTPRSSGQGAATVTASGSVSQPSPPAARSSATSIAQRRAAARVRSAATVVRQPGESALEGNSMGSRSLTNVNGLPTTTPSSPQESSPDPSPVSTQPSAPKSTYASSNKLVGLFSSIGSQLQGILKAKNEKPGQKPQVPENLPMNTWGGGDRDPSFEFSDEADQASNGLGENPVWSEPETFEDDAAIEPLATFPSPEQEIDQGITDATLSKSDQPTDAQLGLDATVALEIAPVAEEPSLVAGLPATDASIDESASPIDEPLVTPEIPPDESVAPPIEDRLTEPLAAFNESPDDQSSVPEESPHPIVDSSTEIPRQKTTAHNLMEEKPGDEDMGDQPPEVPEPEAAIQSNSDLQVNPPSPAPPLDPALHLAMPDPIPLFTPPVEEVEPVVIEMTAVLIEESDGDPLDANGLDSPQAEEATNSVHAEPPPEPVSPRSSSTLNDDDDWF